jgi:hypothetical protein
MLQIDPSKRLSAWECLQHPFFSEIPDIDSEHLSEFEGMYRQKEITVKLHQFTINRSLKNRTTCMKKMMKVVDVIEDKYNDYPLNDQGDDQPSQRYIYNQRFRIVFLALDILDRILMSEKDSSNLDKLVQVALYIAVKYLIDLASPSFKSIIDEHYFKQYSLDSLELLERKALKTLKFVVYRPLVFDLLSMNTLRCIGIESLFNLMLYKDYNGMRIDELVSYIEDNPNRVIDKYSIASPDDEDIKTTVKPKNDRR